MTFIAFSSITKTSVMRDEPTRLKSSFIQDAGACDVYPTARHRRLTFKRARNGYRFFFANVSGVNVIYAIYHQRENWQTSIEDRSGRYRDPT